MEPACIIANITPEPSNTLPTEEEFQLLKATGHNDVTTFTQILKENLDKIDINSLYNGHTLLTHAVVRNRYSICEALLNFAQCDINAPNSQGETPLILAVVKGNENIARLLLESGKILLFTFTVVPILRDPSPHRPTFFNDCTY